ncbi:MAG TPA: SRPBCC family protein [Jatrophihabitans sp.]|jgi:ribosome-associated toxin RatA of RatAB toxin-antitoxin module|nr:SRPBCC family protein [Jatrophihabitans sp.]
MADTGAYTEVIDAPQDKIIDALTDFDHYPEWQSGLLACTVKERDDEGRGSLVEIQVDAKIRKVRYTTRYWYDLDHGRMGFNLVEGDLKECTGVYTFVPQDDGSTRVSIDVTTEVGFFVPGPMIRLIRDQWLRSSMRDLKKRVGG